MDLADSNHNSVDILIEGLNSEVEGTRFESREILDFLFDQQFDSATAANDWWQETRIKYARDLVGKELAMRVSGPFTAWWKIDEFGAKITVSEVVSLP